jgi:putative sterol carrier protein
MSDLRVDAHNALIAARRGLEGAPLRVADGLARRIRRAPDARLEQLMRTPPARRIVLEGIFRQMPQHLVAQQAAGVNAVVRWRITGRADGGADTYQLHIADGRCRVNRGTDGPDPRVTITLGGTELLHLAIGDLDPMQAYFSGRIGLAGDIMLAARLGSLFHIPRPERPPSR